MRTALRRRGWRRRLGLCAAVVIGACASQAAWSQAGTPKLGPMPAPDESRCAQMHFSPHMISIGQLVVADAGPITSACGGPASSVHYAWPDPNPDLNQIPGLVEPHRCSVNAASCQFRAVMFTQLGVWEGLCISGSSPFGGWGSCESYVVKVGKYLRLDGTVFNLHGKTVTVRLSGKHVRATTTTDVDSAVYQFAVLPGRYKVSFRWHGKTISGKVRVHGAPGSSVALNLTA
jgi:hypothetical protein